MGFRMSMAMLDVNFKKAYKTSVKHTILNLGYALRTHHEAPRTHKPHECHLEGPWEHLGASCGPSGSHLGVLWGPSRGLHGTLLDLKKHMKAEQPNTTFNVSRFNHKSSSFSLAWRNARSRLNNMIYNTQSQNT